MSVRRTMHCSRLCPPSSSSTTKGVADLAAGEDEEGRRDEGEARAAGVEGVDCEGSGDDEGEEKGGAEAN